MERSLDVPKKYSNLSEKRIQSILDRYRPEFPKLLEEHIKEGWSTSLFRSKILKSHGINVCQYAMRIWSDNHPDFKKARDTYRKRTWKGGL